MLVGNPIGRKKHPMRKASPIAVALLCAAFVGSGLVARADVIGYWRFEGADDTTGFLADSSGSGLTLTKANTPTQVSASGFNDPIPRNGLTNAKAASLDDTMGGDYFLHEDDALFAVSEFTIEAYVNATDLDKHYESGRHVIASQYTASDNTRSWSLHVDDVDLTNENDKGELRLFVSESGESVPSIASGIMLNEGVNYFVAASFDESKSGAGGGGVKFYVYNLDAGTWEETTTDHTVSDLENATGAFNIGTYDNHAGRCWEGLIDEVRWSNTVLSKSELLAVPEPASAVLLLSSLAMCGVFVRRRPRRKR